MTTKKTVVAAILIICSILMGVAIFQLNNTNLGRYHYWMMRSGEKKENQILINIESTSNQEEDDDLEELEKITHTLREDLSEVDTIEKVELVSKKGGENPKGSKTGEVVTSGSLLITLGASALSNAISNLSNTLQSWLIRHERRKTSLDIGGDKLEITTEQQKQLIESGISRQSVKNGVL